MITILDIDCIGTLFAAIPEKSSIPAVVDVDSVLIVLSLISPSPDITTSPSPPVDAVPCRAKFSVLLSKTRSE